MRGNKDNQIFPGPISQLPDDVVSEILARISSVKTIALCQSVCKAWRGLISNPRFAELHLAHSKICLLVQNLFGERTEKTVYLVEDEDGRHGFQSGHYICGTESCEICMSDSTAITKLKIPVGPKWPNTIRSAFNGLLCLYSEDSPIVVCNPITGEFIYLPDPDLHVDSTEIDISVCGFGLDPKTGQYKVVILYSQPMPEDLMVLKAIVHVLGTDSWRELDTPQVVLDSLTTYMCGPTFFNGALYWVYTDDHNETSGMVSFELDSERLHFRSLPPLLPRDLEVDEDETVHNRVMEVVALGGRLCVYPCYPHGRLDMCTLVDERSSVSDSLLEWISHDLSDVRNCLQIICSLDDGALLMYSGYPAYKLIYYNPPRGSPRFKRLRFGSNALEIVAYTPSFVSLEDIVRPGNAEVLNVYSRSGKLVVDEKARSPSVCEGHPK